MTPLAHQLPSRQDIHFIPSTSPSPTTSHCSSKPYSHLARDYSKSLHLPLDIHYTDYSTDSYYLDSRQSTPSDHFTHCLADSQFMQQSSAQYPEVRVQHSTPSNGLPATPPPLVNDDTDLSSSVWYNQSAPYLVPNAQQQFSPSTYRSHKRLSSGSSVGSAGPDSPYTQPLLYPQIVDPDQTQVENYDSSFPAAGQFAKPDFTAVAQHSDSSFYPAFQNFNINGDNASSMMGVRTQMRHDMPQLRSSNTHGGQGSSGGSYNGEGDSSLDMRNGRIPNFDRTMSDVYQDELYNPASSQPSTTSQPRSTTGPQGHAVPAHK